MRSIFSWIEPVAGVALALVAHASVLGQTPPADPAAVASTSLARYAPAENLRWQLEFDGVDAHADGWKKTAAYRIVNDTPAGEMIASTLGQWVGTKLGLDGSRNAILLKHMLRAGFLVSVGGIPNDPSSLRVVVVVRQGWVNKEVKPVIAQFLGARASAENKVQAVVRAGHKVYSGKLANGSVYTFWVEDSKKEDVVYVMPTVQAAEAVLETLDGKRPNSLTHPARVESVKEEAGFEPVGTLFFDALQFQNNPLPQVDFASAKPLDIRWGFHGDALQTVMRIGLPSPHQGSLAMLDGPSFDKSKFPPLPESNTGFVVMAIDTKAAFDQIVGTLGMVSPAASNAINGAIDSLQSKSKLRFRDDILGHLGPRMAVYGMPTKTSDAGAPAMLAPYLGMLGASGGVRGAIVFETDDPVAFGKALDTLMVTVNREIRSAFARNTPGDPNGDPDGGGRRGGAAPAPEFRLSPTPPKTYILAVPPELSKTIPPSFRPSIRLGTKHVVIATSSDAAREAAESKAMWTPPIEVAGAFADLPGQLKFLQFSDNREENSKTLASFPGKIQILANSPLLGGKPPTARPPGAAPAPGSSGSSSSSSSSSSGSSSSSSSGSSGPGMAEVGAAPSAGGVAAATGPVVIRVAADKLPSADILKGMLFPEISYLNVDAREIRLVNRAAFPDLSSLNLIPFASMMMGAQAGGMMPPGAGPAPAGTPPGGPGSTSSGGPPGASPRFNKFDSLRPQ